MRRTLFILLVILISGYSRAGVFVHSSKLQGSAISNSATLPLQESFHNYMVANPGIWPQQFTQTRVADRVMLKYEESARAFYASNWSITVNFTLFPMQNLN